MTPITIEAGVPSEGHLAAFLSDWPYLPRRHTWGGGRDSLARLVTARTLSTLRDANSWAWTARRHPDISGVATLRRLPWDSDLLGFPAARVELFVSGEYGWARETTTRLLSCAAEQASEAGIRHLSVRVDAADGAAVHALETSGYLNVDALMTFGAKPSALLAPRETPSHEFARATAADSAAMAAVAEESFVDGRFLADPSVPRDRALAIYRRWAEGCAEGTAADATFVARSGGQLTGFVACRLEQDVAVFLGAPAGTIPLIAVGESARGRGVGAALIGHASTWFTGERVLLVEVGTQIRNVPAARLYESCGFRLVAGALSFRLMIDA
jgi:GNAT superfamily N-acetyltransferase